MSDIRLTFSKIKASLALLILLGLIVTWSPSGFAENPEDMYGPTPTEDPVGPPTTPPASSPQTQGEICELSADQCDYQEWIDGVDGTMPVAGLVSKRYWWKTINTIRVGVKLDNTYYLDADGNTTPSISLSEIQVWLPLVDDQMLDRIDGLDGTDDLDQFAREIENELSQELSLSENAHIQYVTIQGTISELRHAAHERVVQTKVDTNYKDYRFTPGTGMDLKMHMTVNAVENFYTQGQGLIEGAARTEIVMLDNTPPVPFSDKFDVFHNIVKHTHYERSPHLSVGIGGILDEYSTENVQAKYYPDGTVWNSEYNFEITPNGGFTRSYSVEHDYSPTVGVTQTSFSNPDNLTAADLNTAVNTLNNIQTSLENNPPAS